MSTEQDTTDSTDNSVTTDVPTVPWESKITRALRLQEDVGSHDEEEPNVFHASSIGYPIWLAYCKAQSLTVTGDDLLGTFKTGTLIHEWMEESMPTVVDNLVFERPVEVTHEAAGGDVTFTGQFDAYDYVNDVVYDFKSRGGWYNFNPPVSRHTDQLQVYMDALDADYGKIIYLSKKDFEVREYPENGVVKRDEDRMDDLVQKAGLIRDGIVEHGDPQSRDEIPFERGDSYFENSTDLLFDSEESQ